MAKKRVVRRKPPAEDTPLAEKLKPPGKKVTERAWVRPGRPSASCSCGKVSLRLEGSKVIITGPGWVSENQWIRCTECSSALRYSPLLVWETPTGAQYTTRGYIKGGDDNPDEFVNRRVK